MLDNEADYPLSFAQERMWLLERLSRSGVLYGMPVVLRLLGDLSSDLLTACLTEIVRRHEVLRTCIRDDGGRPVGVLRPAAPLRIPVRDLQNLDGHAVDDVLAASIREPFDLAAGPLVRISLLRTAKQDHLLVLDFHHSVCDGMSVGLLLDELAELYEASVTGRSARLPHLPIQFADHAIAEREKSAGGGFDDDLTYWKEQLAGAPTVLALPADHRRDATAQPGDNHRFVLPQWTRDGVLALCQKHRVTPFMVMVAAWSVLLARYTAQDDLLIGTPVAGRVNPDCDNLIGLFVNTVVLRVRHSTSSTFVDLLEQCRQSTLEGLLHQGVPVNRVIDALGVSREPGRNPLFQTIFSFEEDPRATLEFGGISVHYHPEPQSLTSKFDVSLHVVDRQSRLEAEFEYRSDILAGTTVQRMARHFTTLLDNAVADPERPVAEISMLTAHERSALLAAGRGSGPAATPDRQPLQELFARQAAEHPDAPAVTFEGTSTSYRELDAAANRLAHELLARGVAPGAAVALLLPRGLDFVVAMLATLKAGAFFVPLDVNSPPQRHRFILDDVGAELVLTNQASVTPPLDGPVLLALDDDGVRRQVAERNATAPAHGVHASAPAYAIYTSGSTGTPKGVLVSHDNVIGLFAAAEPHFGFGDGQVWTWFHSPAFDFSVWEVFGALLHGDRVVAVSPASARSPGELLDLLIRERVTLLSQTPSAFDGLVREVVRRDVPAEALCLRFVVLGGEAVDLTRFRPWIARFGDRGPRLVNMYGITETTVVTTHRVIRAADVEAAAVSPIGRPMPGLDVHLLDERLEPVPVNALGELYVGGPGVALGYLNRPGLTATRFVPDPHSSVPGARLYRSGDLARRRNDGDIDYVGRSDHQVKIRGHRIEAGEVEAVLRDHPQVEQACVVVESDGETTLVGYVVARVDVTSTELRAHLGRFLPDYMIPGAFVHVGELPLTTNGKIDRKRLAEAKAAGLLRAGARTPPRTSLEQDLAGVWSKVLGHGEVGVEDDFFSIGGHSLAALRLAAEATSCLGRAVDPALVFRAPTVRAMADLLEEGTAAARRTGPLVTLRNGAGGATLLLVHPVGGGLFAYASLVRSLGGDFTVLGVLGTEQDAVEITGLAKTYADAVVRAEPGPVVLAGWSLGGSIAYELAQQLSDRGLAVASVIAIDGAASFRDTLSDGHNESLPYRFLHDFVAGLGHALRFGPSEVDELFEKDGFERVLADDEFAAMLPEDFSAAELRKLYDRFRAHLTAADRHQPMRRHDVPVTLIRADGQLHPDPSADLGWSSVTDTPVPIRWIRGDHHTILRDPAVRDLAKELSTALTNAARQR